MRSLHSAFTSTLITLTFLVACTRADVTHLGGPKLPAKSPNCELKIFPSTTPNYPWEDIARVESQCHVSVGRAGCMEELRKHACANGGDTIYDMDEGKKGESHIIIATVAIRDTSKPAPTPASKPSPIAAAPTFPGCQFDTQCKGDRICQAGACVSPTPQAPASPTNAPPVETAE